MKTSEWFHSDGVEIQEGLRKNPVFIHSCWGSGCFILYIVFVNDHKALGVMEEILLNVYTLKVSKSVGYFSLSLIGIRTSVMKNS